MYPRLYAESRCKASSSLLGYQGCLQPRGATLVRRFLNAQSFHAHELYGGSVEGEGIQSSRHEAFTSGKGDSSQDVAMSLAWDIAEAHMS